MDKFKYIQEGLKKIELTQGVKVLFACESGSRCWGIESEDSDWDVRFIYVKNTISWYLKMFRGSLRDVIEHPFGHMVDNIDYSGWDVQKALRLAAASNPALMEWLRSPVVYSSHPPFVSELKRLTQTYNPRPMIHHYLNLAVRQYKTYWRGEEPVSLKKYLYSIRPILCVMWMEENEYELPPVDIDTLVNGVKGLMIAEREAIKKIVDWKRSRKEYTTGRDQLLDLFIQDFTTAEKREKFLLHSPERLPNLEGYEELFLKVLDPRGFTT